MANDYATALALLRKRIQEATALEWDDAGQLLQYLSDGEQWLADLIGKLPGSGKYRSVEFPLTLPAATEYFSLTVGTNPTALAKWCQEVIEIGMQVENGRYVRLLPLRDGEDSYFRGSTSTTTGGLILPRYRFVDEQIQFLPLSTGPRTLKIEYRYLPVLKTTGTLETPQREMTTLVTYASFFALGDAGESNDSFEKQHPALVAAIEARWGGREYGSRSETVRRQTSRVLFK